MSGSVLQSGVVTPGHLAVWDGNGVVRDGGHGAGDVVGPSAAVSGDIATFNGPTGTIIQDSGVSLSSLVASQIIVNVKAAPFNAKGDGTTDDTLAIQAAVAAAGSGGTVFFPTGTYRTTGAISFPPGVSAFGLGPASIIAPSTTSQVAFSFVNSTVLDNDATVHDLEIAPTVHGCVGISALQCRFLNIHDVTFTGCEGNSIAFDRCEWYTIHDCYVRPSVGLLGGTVLCWSSTWNSVSGGYLGGNGTINRVRFQPSTNSAVGQAEPCIHLISQPVTSISQCYLAFGAFGNGPIDFIVIENQCQGNILTGNVALGTRNGITIQPGTLANSVMPSFITLTDNIVDSCGGIAIFVNGSSSFPATTINITGSQLTEFQQICNTVAISAPGAGYSVNDILFGPTIPAGEEGAQVILQVATVGGGGAITSVTFFNRGLTQAPPSNPVAFTGGTGTGATFILAYFPTQAAIWMSYANNCLIQGNTVLNYGGRAVGYGIVLQTVTDTIITDNHITGLANGIYGLDAGSQAIILTSNFLQSNTSDYGGNVPTFSLFQNNIGVPWVTTTPAMPSSGVVVTNSAPYPQQVFIVGGTVTAIHYLGTLVAATTATAPIILIIQPQFTISITYSVAPTWVWVPMT